MLADLADAGPPSRRQKLARTLRYRQWSESREEESAALIAAAYRGHLDATINDQYGSVSGARRFIHNIVQYPGCGSFFVPASLVADRADGSMAGIILGSLVAADTGHVTQVCVAPANKGQGVGYELLRRALYILLQSHCERVSLTVTAGNTEAIELYQRIGFQGHPPLCRLRLGRILRLEGQR